MPTWPLQSQATQYYGDPRQGGWLHANTINVPCPWTLHFDKTPLHQILIHKKCAASLTKVLNAVWVAANKQESVIQSWHFDRFSGSYNFRNKRGGGSLSMHAYACAIDFDYAENMFHSIHHLFNDKSPLVIAFEAEGWIWGGRWSPQSIDAMHFQAALIHA